ncbi:MAG: sulfate adenylyltransferase subunit CysN, partial [Chthoniobacterales bacterium]|nr:sulfate adenylyltransferase subunit CysN [Chthoniobacterales bacterium]
MPLAESARQLAISDIQSYLAEHEQKDLLRFLTCGSVDDGKSTLIGRLFYDCKLIYEDQLTALLRDSQIHGTTGGSFDPALFTDGLKAEREQGITIDVAYRYFSTNRRKFIIADCPGHEQYTRNMATGASHCNLAIILVDARNGITTQTRRHSFIISLLGIRHVVLAVNKMDLVQWCAEIFHNIHREYTDFASRLQFTDLHAIPIAALHGDNVVQRSQNMPWYEGPTLLSHLENVNISADRNLVDLRFPVQYVIRPNLEFRGYAGTIASGILRTGDEVMVVSSARRSRVRRILIGNKEVSHAQAPLAVTICLEDEIDISRGDVLAHPNNLPCYDTDVEAMLIWFDSSPSKTGAVYWAKIGTFTVPVTLTKLRYKTDVNSLRKIENPPNPGLEMNEIGRAHLTFHRPVAFDPYRKNPPLGSFILIDRLTNNTAAAGIILDSATADSRSALSRIHPASRNIQRESSLVLPNVKSSLTGLRPFTLWFTGLSGSGKSTIAKLLERRLAQFGYLSALLDGDNLRHGLCRDLGF